MNRRIAMTGSLLLAGLLAASQLVGAGRRGCPPAPAPAKKAMFWKVTSKDNVAYLLGSIHLGSKSMYPLPKEIEDAFEHSALLAVEIDINHVEPAENAGADLSNRHVSGRRHTVEPRQPGGPPAAGGILRKIRVSSRGHVQNEALDGGHDGLDNPSDEEWHGDSAWESTSTSSTRRIRQRSGWWRSSRPKNR